MTRKDYIAIAEAFARTKPGDAADQHTFRVQWFEDVRAITAILESDNPRFDRDRFHKACGL